MTRLEAIAQELQSVDNATRLELLLDYATALPPLPQEYHPLRDAGVGMVHECQSPVFLIVEVTGGIVRLRADVPREAPTARSFVTLLLQSFDGETPEVVLGAPDDILQRFCLTQLLGMQRTRGLSAIYRRVKQEVARQMSDRT